METTLKKIAYAFQRKRLTWGIGGSYLLKHYGLVNNVRDIDIVIAEEDIEGALDILDFFGERRELEQDAKFDTELFVSYVIEGTVIDVMCNIKIIYNDSFYQYKFDKDAIAEEVFIEGQKYPIMHLEDWYVLYYYMGRNERLNVLDGYIKSGQYFDFSRVEILVSAQEVRSDILKRLAQTF